MKYLPDAAFFDELFGVCDRGHTPVIEPHHRAQTLCRRGHRSGVFDIVCKWLLAKHDFAGFESSNRYLMVQVVGQGYIDYVDIWPIDHVPPIARRFIPSPCRGVSL